MADCGSKTRQRTTVGASLLAKVCQAPRCRLIHLREQARSYRDSYFSVLVVADADIRHRRRQRFLQYDPRTDMASQFLVDHGDLAVRLGDHCWLAAIGLLAD